MGPESSPRSARERLYLFDTTLRDGAQTNGVDFTLADKLAIAKLLDDLGTDYVGGGYPGANLTDSELFAEDRGLESATFTAFGMTRRPGRSASNDPGLVALLDAKADAICFVAKSWDYHVRVALETTLEENLASIRDSVTAARQKGREFTACGMTRRPGRSASNDPGLVALLDAKADAICFVAKSWDYHVRVALETTQ